MKKNIFVFLILLMSKALAAQDIIFKQNGDKIKSKITEISPETIKYKEFDFLDGPVRVLYVKDVLMIIYQNGKKEVFSGADNKNQKSVAKAEFPAPANVTKPSAQKETPHQINATKPAAQKETPPQTNASKPSAEKEEPLSSASQTESVLTSFAGIFKSKEGEDWEIVVTNDGFKLRKMVYPNTWVLYKPTKHPEYICYQVDGKGLMRNFINSKITIINSDKYELLYFGEYSYYTKPEKITEKRKYSLDDLPLINGFWKTVSEKVFAMSSVFELVTTKEGFKITNPDDNNLWALFKVTNYPEFECYQANGKKMLSFQGSKITVEDPENMNLKKLGEKETLKLIRTRYYSVNDAGEVVVNKKKIATIKKTKAGSLMNVTMPDYTIYDLNNKSCLLYQGTVDGKLLFLDDNKSYIPSPCDPRLEAIAGFIAREDILTSEGYNIKYRAEFIKKYRGYDATPGTPENIRDMTAPIQVNGELIRQGKTIIGKIRYLASSWNGSADSKMEILDMGNKLIARIFLSAMDKYNTVTVSIYLGNNSTVERTYKETWSTMNLDNAVRWLVEHNHL